MTPTSHHKYDSVAQKDAGHANQCAKWHTCLWLVVMENSRVDITIAFAIGDLQLVARFFPPVSLLVCWLAMNVIFACYYIDLLPPAER